MPINEELEKLTTELAQANATIERLQKENAELQIEAANKIAAAKVEFETKEINYKKQIKELTLALELRNSNERGKERDREKSKRSVKAIWEEALDG